MNIFKRLFEDIINEAWFYSGSGGREAFRKGSDSEQLFDTVMRRNGFELVDATPDEERRLHIDRKVFLRKKDEKGNRIKAWSDLEENKLHKHNSNSVEVKGNKLDEGNYLTVELLTVNSNRGWLYTHANYISFEVGNEIILVKSRQLMELVEKTGSLRVVPDGNRFKVISTNPNTKVVMIDNKNLCKIPPRDGILYVHSRPNRGDGVVKIPWNLVISNIKPTVRYPKM